MCDKNDFPIFMAITIVCATVSLAEPTSANVVGYYQVTCDKAYNLVPLNLLTIDGGEIDLQDLINTENTVNLTANRVKASADQIKVYNGAGYTDFWLHDGKGSGMSAFKGKWVYLEGTTTKLASESLFSTFQSGDCFFYIPVKSATPAVITIPGQVPSTVTGKLVQGYNLIGSGMPFPLTLNGTVGSFGDMSNYWTAENGFTPNRVKANADQIKVYNGFGYTDYWLHDGKGSGMSAFKGKWVYLEGTTTKAVTESIPLTSGFFFIKKAAGEIQFRPPMPYSL